MNFYNKHLLNDFCFKKYEILLIFELIKKNIKINIKKNVCILNEKQSLRTINILKNSLNYLNINLTNLNNCHNLKKENFIDFCRTIGNFYDKIYYRSYNDIFIKLLSKYSGSNVINLLSNSFHPIQSLSDFSLLLNYKKNFLYFFGNINSNVIRSLLIISSKLNYSIILFFKKKNLKYFFLKKLFLNKKIIFTEKLILINKKSLLYTDVWFSMGENYNLNKDYNNFVNFQINKNILKILKIKKILHCLPSLKKITKKKIDFEIVENIFESNFFLFNKQIINKIKIFNLLNIIDNFLFFKI